jgi:3-oxoacyl-[acyl-carrier protein] reductase
MKRLDEKTVIITGAARGIGLATARLFAAEGAKVVAADADEGALEEQAFGTEGVLAVPTDITDPGSVKRLVAHSLEAYGRIDALVHYAGITRDTLHWKMSLEAWEQVIRVNLTGSFVVAQAVAEVMRAQQSGSIVLTASRVYLGNIGQANYAASKGGVVSLARTLALELGKSGVRVNALAPGFVETQMTAAVPAKVRDKAVAATPLQRTGQAEEVARAALFLASDEASFITGQVLFVDGGRSLGMAPA